MTNNIRSAHTYKLSDDGAATVVCLLVRGEPLSDEETALLIREAQPAIQCALSMIEAGRSAPATERNPDAIREAFRRLGDALEREIATVAA